MAYKNKEDQAKNAHAHYLRNKEVMKKRAKLASQSGRRRNRELLDKLKDKPCMDCKQSYPSYVMDYDHVRGKKDRNVSKLSNFNLSIERLMAEIAKCDLVCANCHRIRTHNRMVEK